MATRITGVMLMMLLLAVPMACGDDGTPLGERSFDVPLAWADDSNWGPMDATGLASINTVTGQVDIQVQGLPMLTDELYEGWLAGGGEDPISTAKFNTDDTGTGSSTILLGDISTRTYTRVVLTVEPEPDPTPKPDPRHSIGGPIPEAP